MKKILLTLILLTVFINAEAAERFSRSGDIVTDSTTGLMWQDNAEAATVIRDWQGAINYCEALELGSYTDWRLPNIRELKSIVDRTIYNPAIDPVFQNIGSSSRYWSSTADVDSTSGVRGVDFYHGYDSYVIKTDNHYARCVSGGQ